MGHRAGWHGSPQTPTVVWRVGLVPRVSDLRSGTAGLGLFSLELGFAVSSWACKRSTQVPSTSVHGDALARFGAAPQQRALVTSSRGGSSACLRRHTPHWVTLLKPGGISPHLATPPPERLCGRGLVAAQCAKSRWLVLTPNAHSAHCKKHRDTAPPPTRKHLHTGTQHRTPHRDTIQRLLWQEAQTAFWPGRSDSPLEGFVEGVREAPFLRFRVGSA